MSLTKKGFTLVEVLLTLGIIGVVAAITIPNLVQNSQNRELVSGLKKTYNTLTNGFKQSEVLLGKTTDIPYLTEREISGTTEREKYISYLTYDIKTMDNCEYDICLPDGQTITVGEIDTSCTTQASGSAWQLKHTCAILQVDVNGRKNPNKDAKDRYELAMTRYGIYPLGDKTDCSGLDCSAYTLANNKIYDGLLECGDGYKNSNGTCTTVDIANCKTYDGATCTGCKDGNYLNGSGTCSTLPENCTAANKNGKCSSCEDGYYAKAAGTCEIKPAFCSTMLDDGASCSLANGTQVEVKKLNGKDVPYITDYDSSGQYKYQTGAEKACNDMGMRLPTLDEVANQGISTVLSTPYPPGRANGTYNGINYACDGAQNYVNSNGIDVSADLYLSAIYDGGVRCSWNNHVKSPFVCVPK